MIQPKYIRRGFTLLAVLFALPLQWGVYSGISIWFSPFVLLNSLFLLKSMVLLNVLGWIVLLVLFYRNRWFCRYLCPVGWACDTVSKAGLKKGARTVKKIPRLGGWLAMISLGAAITGIPLFILLDPLAIFNGFFTAFSEDASLTVFFSLSALPVILAVHLFLPGVWCTKICPLGGLSDVITRLRKAGSEIRSRKKSPSANAFGRRIFIASGTGLLAGVFLPSVIHAESGVRFRPPASLPGKLFNTLCVRCGNCIKACPSNIIVHHREKTNLTAWMTPEISFEQNGYCPADCNLCGSVCPSGSISPFSLVAKKKLFIAGIEIGLEQCLLTQQTECDRCKAVCPYDAILIVPAADSIIMKPLPDLKKCVGCGACAAVCPTETIQMISINKA
jgi:ferredoxin-type protein NapF